MISPREASAPATGDVVLLVGTLKGAFLFHAGPDRTGWRMEGPHFPGETIYAMAYDGRAGGSRILASTNTFHWGAVVRASDDFGATWTAPDRKNVRFAEGTDDALVNIWQLRPGRESEPGVVYCGVEPAALFRSDDGGERFAPVQGLLDHPHRARWQPGGGGLCLHTIVLHPTDARRMLVAISTGGVYRTDDGGATWEARNHGVRAQFLPDPHPEFGQCVHKVVSHPARPDRLYLQNHWGLYRSDDWGDSWHDVANGVPSDFGFALEVHPRDPDTAYVIPLTSDEFRIVPDARLRVYRTQDAGASWHPLERGLPQRDAYETVLRDGLCTDGAELPGLYFGTRSGKLFASADAGESWTTLADALPPIACVKAAVVGGGTASGGG